MVLRRTDGKRNVIRTTHGYAECNPIVNPFNLKEILGFEVQFFSGKFMVVVDPHGSFRDSIIGKPFLVTPNFN